MSFQATVHPRFSTFVAAALLPAFALMLSTTAPTRAEQPADKANGSSAQDQQANSDADGPEKKLFHGKVVKLQEALRRRGIKAYKEAIENQVVLETPSGELIPIVPDWRGRAFYQDKRLRNRKVDLVGYRKEGVPYLQVLMVFTFNDAGERQYTDYWCDICSIPMYEIKPCDCCQGPIRLRFQHRDLPDYLSTQKRTPQSKGRR